MKFIMVLTQPTTSVKNQIMFSKLRFVGIVAQNTSLGIDISNVISYYIDIYILYYIKNIIFP